MNWVIFAPLIFVVVLTLPVGGVLLVRRLTKRIGDIVELMLRERYEGSAGELRRMGDLLEGVDARMTLLEERQDFTERLQSPAEPAKHIDDSPQSGA